MSDLDNMFKSESRVSHMYDWICDSAWLTCNIQCMFYLISEIKCLVYNINVFETGVCCFVFPVNCVCIVRNNQVITTN